MSRTRLSKISMTPQGAWDSTTEYKRLDVVSNAGASWLAKQDNVGVTPVDGKDWQCLFPTKKFELIETITLTEDTDGIDRATEPNGTAYNFLKTIVTVTLPKGTAKTEFYIKYYANGAASACYLEGTLNSNYFQRYTSWVDTSSGLLQVGNSALTIGYGTTADNIETDPSIYRQSGTVFTVTSGVKRIYLIKGADNHLKAGTVINIYAVRA